MHTVHTPGHTPVYAKYMGERDEGTEGEKEGVRRERKREEMEGGRESQ